MSTMPHTRELIKDELLVGQFLSSKQLSVLLAEGGTTSAACHKHKNELRLRPRNDMSAQNNRSGNLHSDC